MTVAEIREIINLFKQNKNIIQDDSFCHRVINLFNYFCSNGDIRELEGGEELLNDSEANEVLVEIAQTEKIILMTLQDDKLFSFICGCNPPSRILEVALPHILNLLKTDKEIPYEITSSIELFEYIYNNEPTLLNKLQLERVFSDINEEILNKYGNLILEYISNNKITTSTPWYHSELLINYIIKNNPKLLKNFEIQFLLKLDINEELLNQIGDIILENIRNSPDLYISLSTNQVLFDYVKKHDPSQLYKFSLNTLIPTLTPEIIEKYGDAIIDYLSIHSYSTWEPSRELFQLIAKKRPALFKYFDIEKIFNTNQTFDKELLDQYGEAIIEYLKVKKIPYYWRRNKVLLEYVSQRDMDLASKFDLGVIFEYATADVLEKNLPLLIKYIQTHDRISELNTNKYLFDLVKQQDKTLLSKFLMSHIYPTPTKEFIEELGPEIIEFIKNNPILSYSWESNKDLFEYVTSKEPSLTIRFNLRHLYPDLTDEVIKEHKELFLNYIERRTGFYLWDIDKNEPIYKLLIEENRLDLIKKINIGPYFNKEEYITKLASKINMDKEMLKYKLMYLYQKNDELFRTLDFNILKIDTLDISLLGTITLYPDIQNKIIKLDPSLIKTFSNIIKKIKNPNIDLSSLMEKVLNNIENYKELLTNISIDSLNEEQLKNLLIILQRRQNIFNITSINDLIDVNFKEKKESYFKNIEQHLADMDLNSLQRAVIERYFGIDYEMALFIVTRYVPVTGNIDDLQKEGLNKNIVNILKLLSNILGENDLETLKVLFTTYENNPNIPKIDNDFYTSLSLESAIRKQYAQLYNKTLYKLKEEDKTKRPELQNVTYNGQHIQIYEINEDFNLQVHGLGAYREWSRPENFQDDWNRPKIAYHGICTSYIGNDQIATVRPNGPILGFSEYEESALLLSGNYDLFSDDAINSFSTSVHKAYNFLPPRSMINSTRHNHNEMVLERRNNQGISYKRLPNYIVYVVDSIDNKNNFDPNNEYYQMCLQAASDFNIPIVIVDRLKFAKREKFKCDQLEEAFNKTGDLEVLKELFLRYMNNGVGCRMFDGQQHAEYHDIFSSTSIQEFYQRIINYVKNNINNIEQYNKEQKELIGKQIFTLIELLINEQHSYAASHKAQKMTPPIDLINSIAQLQQLFEEYKNRIDNTISLPPEYEETISSITM